jgi:hypothetical protein
MRQIRRLLQLAILSGVVQRIRRKEQVGKNIEDKEKEDKTFNSFLLIYLLSTINILLEPNHIATITY